MWGNRLTFVFKEESTSRKEPILSSQDLETGCPKFMKLAIVELLGVLFFRGDYNILKLETCMLI